MFIKKKKPKILKHINTRPHISAANSAVTDSIRFEFVPHPPYSLDLVPSHFWFSQLSRNISKEFISHVMKIWLQEQPEEFYTRRFKKLVRCWQRITMWKNEVQKQSTPSELYFVFCFISIPCVDESYKNAGSTFQTPYMAVNPEEKTHITGM
jgi:hypothetical protein